MIGSVVWRMSRARLPGGGPETDDDLVEWARRGDPSAFDELLRRYQKRVYNLAYRMMHNAEEAEDITQETFLQCFESLPCLRKRAAVGAWICRIASNLCLTRLRARRSRREVLVDPLHLQAYSLQSVESNEDLRRVRKAMAQLPPKYRLVLVAYYLEGRSYEETGRVVGVGTRTVKTQLYRARRLLRAALKEGAIDAAQERQ